MKSFFEGIQYFFEQILFAPMEFFRFLELENWWSANIVNWIFIIVCMVAVLFWLKQLRGFQKKNDDIQDTTAHSFLK
ncbi:MAG: uracil phosphoribosyltransferase [Flavobacteriaceae bacterium]